MPLPEPILDDLRFQKDLVDEARLRIIRYCPEWTDYNLSDPGITLIELFAWMTELLTYRLNRVPEKNYIRFLNLLGVQLQPPSSARTELTFWLSVPLPLSPEDTTVPVIPQGTQVTTRRTEGEEEIIFTTDERLAIEPPLLVQLRREERVPREEDLTKNYFSRMGLDPFYAFNREHPKEGDTFYLGFDEAHRMSGQILQLTFECFETQATGIRREDPPLVWECSLGQGKWEEIAPSTRTGEKDTTGGLNNARGKLVLYLPLIHQPDEVQGKRAYWVRCRFDQRRPEQGTYTQSPRIRRVHAHTLGGTVWATHAVVQADEQVGQSNGEPGQVFKLQHAPVLEPGEGETVEVEELRDGELVFVSWERVTDFSRSDRYARHYTLELASGEICFGPAIRQRDGTVRQYGRVPGTGRQIRFSHYRYGGGATGNVPVDKLQVLRVAIPYIDRVTNLRRAEGGRDQENLEEAKMRARRELRAQQRAVTAEDFENLAKQASRSVARVKCRTPGKANPTLPPGMVELLIIPSAVDALRAGDLSKLWLDPPLREEIMDYLDQYRLLTTTLTVREPRYWGIQVTAEVVPTSYQRPEIVQARVIERLHQFLTPLAFGAEEILSEMIGQSWEGWPFGRDLYLSEVFSLIQQVPGVKHVLDVKLAYRELALPREAPVGVTEAPETVPEAVPELTPVTGRLLEVPPDTVLCSLRHEVKLVNL